LNLGFDNKMNVFLYNSQRFLTETQPSVKAYKFYYLVCTNNSKQQQHPCKVVEVF